MSAAARMMYLGWDRLQLVRGLAWPGASAPAPAAEARAGRPRRAMPEPDDAGPFRAGEPLDARDDLALLHETLAALVAAADGLEQLGERDHATTLRRMIHELQPPAGTRRR